MNVCNGAEIRSGMRRECDVVVVGSGPAGSAAARELAAAGTSVIVVEEGPLVEPEDYHSDAFTSMSQLYRDMGASVTTGRAPMPFLQGRAVGGTSVVNGAISWRLPRDVYDEWCSEDAELRHQLPWREIEEAVDWTEKELGVAPTTDEDVRGANNDLMARGAEALGLEHRPIGRNVKGCEGLGQCLQGCPRGHKQSMERTFLPAACRDGAEVIANVEVGEILQADGRAMGVAGAASGGGRVEVRADAVVLAASAVQTPLLLLRNGIDQGPVGEGFQCHPGVSVSGRFEEEVNVWSGATQGHEVIGLRRDGIKFEALGFDIAVAASRAKRVGSALVDELADLGHRAHWGAAVKAEARGRVRTGWLGGTRVDYNVTETDVRRLRRGISILGQLMLAAGAEFVTPGIPGWDTRVESIERMRMFEEEGPLDARFYAMVATHMFGTCRMGSDPFEAVVRPDFRHHHVDRLYVADSSVFPTNTGVNPQTSIIALATICGRRVASA